MIVFEYREEDFDYELRALVSGFFPKQRFCERSREQGRVKEGISKKERILWICFDLGRERILIRMELEAWKEERTVAMSGEEDFHKHSKESGASKTHPYRTYYKNQLKKLCYEMLSEIPEDVLGEEFERRIPVWGTMTGVRPTKIPMQELLSGVSEEEVKEHLRQTYCCSEEKSRLCMKIAKTEAELLKDKKLKLGYSLYLGIPFCPTTCLYCSFPSYPMEQFEQFTEPYLLALFQEIEQMGKRCEGHPLFSTYLGGGTPTALSVEQLDRLLSMVQRYFPASIGQEFTVEAGRPDSITREKLCVLRSHGICRISVNPQTMQQKTLDLIGRKHTVEETKRAFFLAREIGFENINMDLIAGLPGENVEDFADTLEQVMKMEPDGVTVHSLVVKRASRLREVLLENSEGYSELARRKGMEQMLSLATEELAKQRYFPYYMYRQKNAAGYAGSDGQENIGFARQGKECLYNILIMEEMQTIVALGAGASTKKYKMEEVWYQGEKRTHGIVQRIENVKSVTEYIGRVDEMVERKEGLYGGDF